MVKRRVTFCLMPFRLCSFSHAPGPVPTAAQPSGRGYWAWPCAPHSPTHTSREGPEGKTSRFRGAPDPWPSQDTNGWAASTDACARQEIRRPALGLLALQQRVAVSRPLFFSSCLGSSLQGTTPSAGGPLAAPQGPPGSLAPPAHAASKQVQENTTHVKTIDAGTSADPERGAQTPACLAQSFGPVMSDMCSVVCEPAAPAACLAGASLSGRVLNQAELLAPGTHGDRPPTPPGPPCSQDVSRWRRKREASATRETVAPLISFQVCQSRFPGCAPEAGSGQAEVLLPCTAPWPASPVHRASMPLGRAPATWAALPWQLSLPTLGFPSSWPRFFS